MLRHVSVRAILVRMLFMGWRSGSARSRMRMFLVCGRMRGLMGRGARGLVWSLMWGLVRLLVRRCDASSRAWRLARPRRLRVTQHIVVMVVLVMVVLAMVGTSRMEARTLSMLGAALGARRRTGMRWRARGPTVVNSPVRPLLPLRVPGATMVVATPVNIEREWHDRYPEARGIRVQGHVAALVCVGDVG